MTDRELFKIAGEVGCDVRTVKRYIDPERVIRTRTVVRDGIAAALERRGRGDLVRKPVGHRDRLSAVAVDATPA